MILGRSTPQWVSLVTAAGGLIQILAVTVFALDAVLVATIIGSVVTFLGVFLAFLANTATTPVADPILPEGTTVKVQDSEDTVLIQKTPPGPVGGDGGAAEG